MNVGRARPNQLRHRADAPREIRPAVVIELDPERCLHAERRRITPRGAPRFGLPTRLDFWSFVQGMALDGLFVPAKTPPVIFTFH